MKSLDEEKRIINLLSNSLVNWKNELHKIMICEKPKYSCGEGKTDIYALLDNEEEIKISLKQNNADFIENKVSATRAERIFGNEWDKIITSTALSLRSRFEEKQIYYPEKRGRIEKGSYTIGWRLDITNKKSGNLSVPFSLTSKQKEEIIYGTSLDENKRNAIVNGKKVPNCGVANYILLEGYEFSTPQEIINNLLTIENYSIPYYASFKAVNYRSETKQIDGNRPLAVYIDWNTKEIIFSNPLVYGAKKDLLPKLLGVLKNESN